MQSNQVEKQFITTSWFNFFPGDSGECSAISAPAGYGKTYWLKAQTNAIYLDCQLLPEVSAQALFELILRECLYQYNTPELEIPYRELCSPTATTFSISRAFQRGLDEIFKVPEQNLLLAFDHAEEVLEEIPHPILRQLAGLYRRYNGKLTFHFATRLPLPLHLERRADFDRTIPFLQLFPRENMKQLPLPSTSQALNFSSFPLSQKQLTGIFTLVGGHPGLALCCTRLILQGQIPTLACPEIELECRKLWHSLYLYEQETLVQRLNEVAELTTHPYLGTMVDRGLINSRGEIFSPLFAEFIASVTPPPIIPEKSLVREAQPLQPYTANISYDPYREEVWLEGGKRKLPLVGNAATLFKYLYLRQSKPWCSREELITAVWGNGGYSNENLDRLVSDLRGDIGDTEKQIIRTLTRRGLLMVGVKEAVGVRT